MKKGLIFFVAVALIVISFVVAFAASRAKADEEVTSPLYEVRVSQAAQGFAESANIVEESQKDTLGNAAPQFVSLNPGSFCLFSGCFGSLCIFSYCLASYCAPSATCPNSGCLASACLGSQCIGSGCLGSVCLGCD